MQTAIVRHILVKDKDLAEQLKRSYKMVPTSQKLPSNIPPVIRQNVAVNLAKSKGQLVPVIDKVVFTAAERVLQGPIKSQFGYHLLEVKFRMGSLR